MADERLWIFEPVDTWFFRSGVPFRGGDAVLPDQVRWLPTPETVQGAVRTALAWARGWRPERPERWPPELGDADDLGALELVGPFVWADGQAWWPLPQHWVRARPTGPAGSRRADAVWAPLTPTPEPVLTDQGALRLPVAPSGLRVAPAVGHWISAEGLGRCLEGREPENGTVREAAEWWSPEFRVGLTLQPGRRVAEPHLLYQSVQWRSRSAVGIGVVVRGIPGEWQDQAPAAVPFGGEQRWAAVRVTAAPGLWPPAAGGLGGRDGLQQLVVALVTPMRPAPEVWEHVIRHGPLAVPAVCAVVPGFDWAGGWDLRRRRPRPLVPVIPAGSVWYYEMAEGEAAAVWAAHGTAAGTRTAWGYGRMVVGRWEERACVTG